VFHRQGAPMKSFWKAWKTAWSDDVEILELTSPGHYNTTGTINGEPVAPTRA